MEALPTSHLCFATNFTQILGFFFLQDAESVAVTEERAWGNALLALHSALLQGRRFVWEEASRKIGILALSPPALLPEHLVQVREHSRRQYAKARKTTL